MIRKLQELEVLVKDIGIIGNSAIINFKSGKNIYSIRVSKKKSEDFKKNVKYTAFIDYEIPFINIKELKENEKIISYSDVLSKVNKIVKANRYIHSIYNKDKKMYEKN